MDKFRFIKRYLIAYGEFPEITADSGSIANWVINGSILESQSGNVGLDSTFGESVKSIWAGGSTAPKFYVTQAGYLYRRY